MSIVFSSILLLKLFEHEVVLAARQILVAQFHTLKVEIPRGALFILAHRVVIVSDKQNEKQLLEESVNLT